MNATHDAHADVVVEEIVRRYFDALDTSDGIEQGGYGSQRDAAEADLKKHLDLPGLEDALRETEDAFEGFWYIAQHLNPVAMMVVSDARERTRVALRRVKQIRNDSEA